MVALGVVGCPHPVATRWHPGMGDGDPLPGRRERELRHHPRGAASGRPAEALRGGEGQPMALPALGIALLLQPLS